MSQRNEKAEGEENDSERKKTLANFVRNNGRLPSKDNRDLKQHDAVMWRRRSLAIWLFYCSYASLIIDPI